MKTLPLLLATALLAGPVAAQDSPPAKSSPPERVSELIVYGDDPCPRSSDTEIVICARQPESERYRVPKAFRNKPKTDAPATAWGAKSLDLEYVNRQGLPNSCNATGSNGQTGCYRKFLAQARAEREQRRREAARVP